MIKMILTNQQKLMIGSAVLAILLISLILFLILKPKHSSDNCEWTYSDWSVCDSSGNQTRTTTSCQNTSGIVCADTTKCGTPILSQSCTSPDTCSWKYTDWSVCTDQTPNQTRTATCQNTSGIVCDNSKCTSTKDDLTKKCVLSCCDKTQTLWTCNPATPGCLKSQTRTYDCSSCTNTFPDNVYIFTQTDANSPGDMQNKINNLFNGPPRQGGIGNHKKKTDNPGQNSLNNYAFLFMPGTYNVDIPIGYYTHVAGLGKNSTDVTMTGGPIVENGSDDYQIGALNNFWRSCENMTVNPTKTNYLGNNTMTYAVSQACSLRSVNINGNLALAEMADSTDMGYSSGGFMANCKISGILAMGSQQQFICRNTEYGTFPDTSWNHVNVGCTSTQGARKGCCIPTPTKPVAITHNLTVVDKTPSVYEKPYLASLNPRNPTDRNSIINSIVVMCPSLLTNSSGTSNNTNIQIPSTNYRIVNENITGALLNQILANTDIHCIIFSPGRYNIETPINLSNQLLFGLGLPVLRSTNDNSIVVGYGSMCGIIFDAGSGGNGHNILVNLKDTSPSHLWDIYCRVGGGTNNTDVYSIDTMLYIGGNSSILDNVWCWVADHYADDNSYVGWDKAICNTGINVSGKDVIAYGLFSEHTRNRNVYWSGDNGQVYMFQSEFNYYIPTLYDFVSYEIDPKVSNHKLYGAGAYSFFENEPTGGDLKVPMVSAGFKWGSTNVDYQNLVTVFLNGYGGISYIFNTIGIPVQYNVDAKGNVGTQIAIACKDDGSCDCYPSCDTSISTCNKDLYRCKPNAADACSVEIVKSLSCPKESNWNCPGLGCFSEKDAQSDCPKTKCQMW